MPARYLRSVGRPLQVGGLLAFIAAIVLTFTYGAGRSVAAGVTVTVTPNSGLHDGDTVHVQASGLPPNHASVQVVECVQGATDSSMCDGDTLDVSGDSDQNGDYDNPAVIVYTRSTANHNSINCDANNPCEIYVGTDYNNAFATDSGTANISFSGTAATTTSTTPPPTTTTTSSSGPTTTTIGGTTTTTGAGGTTTTSVDPNATTTTTAVGVGSGGDSSGTGTNVSGSSSSSGSTLPLTSAPPLAPWLAGFGVLAFVSGTAVRRSALRAAAQTA